MKLPKVSAVIAAAVLAPAVLFPSSASAADKPQPTGVSGPDTASDAASDAAGDHTAGGHTAGDQEQRDRAEVERILADKEIGPGVREAGEKALKGGAAELRHFLAVELDKQRGDDNRVKVSRILAAATGRAVKEAANRAMSGTDEDVVKFLKEGQFTARAEDDDRAEVERILADKEIGPGVREAGEKALKGGAAELRHFLAVELDKQRGDDNRVKVSQILAAATGRAVKEAANRAMSGTDEDVVKFLKEGWAKARAEDEANAARTPAPAQTPAQTPAQAPAQTPAPAVQQPQPGQPGQGVQPAAVTTTTTGITTAVGTTDTTTAAAANPGQLAATGTDGLGWEAGGAAAAVAAGATLVAVSRRRSAEG